MLVSKNGVVVNWDDIDDITQYKFKTRVGTIMIYMTLEEMKKLSAWIESEILDYEFHHVEGEVNPKSLKKKNKKEIDG